MTTIKLKNGSGAPTAGDLAQGEPALDLTNKRLYTEDSGGTVIEVGTNPTSITTGAITSTGVDVTGTVTSDGLRVDGTPVRFVSTAPMLNFMESGVTDSNHRLRQNAGNFVIQKLSDDEGTATDRISIDGGTGDISLYSGVVQIGPSGSTGDRELRFETGSGSASGEDAIINSYRSNADLILKTNDTDRMRIDSSGNVGIGGSTITDPNLLNIQGSSASVNIGVVFNDTNTSRIFGIQNGGSSLKFFDYTANAERMRIDASGNVGIGTSSPFFTASGRVSLSLNGSNSSILAFGKNGSSENYILADAGGFTIANTSATLPTIFFNNAAERMRIDSSGNLLHGITGVPTGVLLGKQLVSSSPTGSEIIAFREDSSVAVGDKCGALLIGNSDPDGAEDHFVGMWGKVSSTNGSQNLHFAAGRSGYEGDSPQMTLDSSGNVGIGTSSPSAGLELNLASGDGLLINSADVGTIKMKTTAGSVKNWGFAHTNVAAGDFGIYQSNSNGGDPITAGTARMYFNGTGDVGIGTSPSSKLHVYSAASTASIVQDAGTALRFLNNSGTNFIQSGTSLTSDSKAPLIFSSMLGVTEWMRLDTSGNLMVGNTAYNTGDGNILQGNGEVFSTIANSLNTLHVYDITNSAFRFYVSGGGQIHATNTSITAISDQSLKENIRDLDKGLESVLALQPRRFDWKNGDGNDIMGFVAQEVEEVMPELIHEYKYNDEETKLGLKMGDMIPSLVKAIQEQNEIINDLRARVAQLEGET